MLQKIRKSIGIGLRSEHHCEVISTKPKVSWWEVHTENFFAEGGAQLTFLEKIRAHYPLSFHGVGLSLGSYDKPSITHLRKIKSLINKFKPFLVSEHISWSSINSQFANDLLPIPYTKESLEIICRNITITQDFLKTPILMENPSSYLSYQNSLMSEEEFINRLAQKTGCKILLDINNIFVSAYNNSFNAKTYIENLDLKNVAEIHLAGHSILKTPNFIKLLDTHNDIVRNEVWDLFKYTMKKINNIIPTLIEWDQDLPPLAQLMQEAKKAELILESLNETERVTA